MFFTDWDNYRKALSLTHNLQQKYGIFDDLKKYFNSTVDFLNSDLDPTQVIACMHQLSLLVVGNLSKYWKADYVRVILSHALRHCVLSLDPFPLVTRIFMW